MKEFRVMLRYEDKRHDAGYRVEYPSVKNHEELTDYLLNKHNKRVTLIKIFYDTEQYCDKRTWTMYRSLEEYLNRDCKGFDASPIYKQKAEEQEKYAQQLDKELSKYKRTEGIIVSEKTLIEIEKAKKYMMEHIQCTDVEKTCSTHLDCSSCPYFQFKNTVLFAFNEIAKKKGERC